MTHSTLSAALQRVAHRFAVRLPERLDRLEADAEALSSKSSKDEFFNVERALHDLAGTAATLGFAELGVAARDAERRVGDIRLEDERRSADQLAMIVGAVHAVRESIGSQIG